MQLTRDVALRYLLHQRAATTEKDQFDILEFEEEAGLPTLCKAEAIYENGILQETYWNYT